MTPKNVAIEPELFARVTEEAAAEGTTADETKRAEELGITEDDLPRLIAESRAERRR